MTTRRSPESTLLLSVLGILVSIFVAVGVWFHSDIQEARQAASAAEVKSAQEELKRDVDRRELAAWGARIFTTTCEMQQGTYDGNAKSCNLPNGQVFRYEPPFP